MRGTRDDGMPADEISNIRFLVEQQIRTIDDLDRRGLDARPARELLSRLMRRHEQIRAPVTAPGPLRVA